MDMPNEIIPVMADPNLIVQVIVNLADNAIKYSEEDSAIVISAQDSGEYAVISVADNGTGIPLPLSATEITAYSLLSWALITIAESSSLYFIALSARFTIT